MYSRAPMRLSTIAQYLSLVAVCGAFYVASFLLQVHFLTFFDYMPKASLFFIPAGIKLVAFVVARSAGLVGVSLGVLLTLTTDTSWHPPHVHDYFSVMFFNAVVPYIGAVVAARTLGVSADLRAIRLWQIIVMAVWVSIVNGVSMNAYLLIEGVNTFADFDHGVLAATFGDVSGIVFTLFLISISPHLYMGWQRVKARR